MGKTATIKHNPLSNPRSRASKRQISPSINIDKSLKTLSPPSVSSVLGPRPNAGVSKRKSKIHKSSKQKQRDAKRQNRAEAVMEKMEVKVGKKGKRVKTINERKSEWGIVNGEGNEERRKAVLGGLGNEDEWQDVEGSEMEEVVQDGSMAAPVPVVATHSEASETIEVVTHEQETVDDEDKIT